MDADHGPERAGCRVPIRRRGNPMATRTQGARPRGTSSAKSGAVERRREFRIGGGCQFTKARSTPAAQRSTCSAAHAIRRCSSHRTLSARRSFCFICAGMFSPPGGSRWRTPRRRSTGSLEGVQARGLRDGSPRDGAPGPRGGHRSRARETWLDQARGRVMAALKSAGRPRTRERPDRQEQTASWPVRRAA